MITFDHTCNIPAKTLLNLAKQVWTGNSPKISAIKIIRMAGRIDDRPNSVIGLKEAKDFCEAGFENIPQPGDLRYSIHQDNAMICIAYDSATKKVFYRSYDSDGIIYSSIITLNNWLQLRTDPI